MGTVFAVVCIFLTNFANSSTLNDLGLAFGPDGSIYLSGCSSSNGMVTISRITPEPCTLLLLGLGCGDVEKETLGISVNRLSIFFVMLTFTNIRNRNSYLQNVMFLQVLSLYPAVGYIKCLRFLHFF
jgi:hypothetical protein